MKEICNTLNSSLKKKKKRNVFELPAVHTSLAPRILLASCQLTRKLEVWEFGEVTTAIEPLQSVDFFSQVALIFRASIDQDASQPWREESG